MSLVSFIGARFNKPGCMPRSVRVMRAVAGIGIAVATAALIVSASIGKGFEGAYSRALLDFNSHIVLMGAGEIEEPAAMLESLQRFGFRSKQEEKFVRRWGWILPMVHVIEPFQKWFPGFLSEGMERLNSASGRGLISATPFLYREALIVGEGGIRGVVIKGIKPGMPGSLGGMRVEFNRGDDTVESALSGKRDDVVPVILGAALSSLVSDGSSDSAMKMLIPSREDTRNGAHKFVSVRSVGKFESGMHDYDAEFMVMDIDNARRLFGAGTNTVSGIELRIDDPERARYVANSIEEELGPPYSFVTWQELNHDLLSAIKLERLVSAIIMGIMIVVASLNIVAFLVLTTIRRLPEIATLKALGIADRTIGKIFAAGGLDVGIKGILAGICLGLGLAVIVGEFRIIPLDAEIYMVSALPIDISWAMCGTVALFCAFVVLATSKIAALRLASVNLAEGLARAR